MKNQISYEYKVEQVDKHGDIIDSNHYDNIDDAFADQDLIDGAVKIDVCLVRDVGNNQDGLIDRQHAYIIFNGKRYVPEEFDNGAVVSHRHRSTIRKAIAELGGIS